MNDKVRYHSDRARAVRVFLSSTFSDMQAEREELVKRVFPRVGKFCRSRYVNFVAIDLRWGITDEQKAEGKVLSICLEEIDRCRPYFIGLLGSRYGSVPEHLPPDLIERYPRIASEFGMSVTELEMQYGVLDNPAKARALFLLRHPEAPTAAEDESSSAPSSLDRVCLQRLMERIRRSGAAICDGYRTAQEAGERAYQFLTEVIDKEFPLAETPSEFALEDAAQAAFIKSHAEFFVSEGFIESYLNTHVSADAPPLLLAGEPGAGKTAILANWIARHLAKTQSEDRSVSRRLLGGPEASQIVLSVFAGASAESTNWTFVLRYLMHTLAQRSGMSVEVPVRGEPLIDAFAHCVAHIAAKQQIVLVIDGIDHLWAVDGAHSLFWLPHSFPENVRVILSSGRGRVTEEAKKRGWTAVTVPTLREDQRRMIAESNLAAFGKKLSEESLAEVVSSQGARSPAFLRSLLSELRVHGKHSSLTQVVSRYAMAKNNRELIAQILERWERDYDGEGSGFVGIVLSLLWCARGGLSEAELAELLDQEAQPFPRVLLATLISTAGELLVERSERITIAQSDMRQSVEDRYLQTDETKGRVKLRLAEYLARKDFSLTRKERPDGRSWHEDLRELADLLAAEGAWQRLAETLTDTTFLTVACLSGHPWVARHWRTIESNSDIRIRDCYRQAIDYPNDFGPARDAALLLADCGHAHEALAILSELIARYRLPAQQFGKRGSGTTFILLDSFPSIKQFKEEEDWLQVQMLFVLLHDRCAVNQKLRALDAAVADLTEAERIAESCGYYAGVAQCKIKQGELAGDKQSALNLNNQAIVAARQGRNLDSLAQAATAAAITLAELGRVEEARRTIEDAIESCLEAGNAVWLGSLYGNLGVAQRLLARPQEALRSHEESERWFRRLTGDEAKADIAKQLDNQADLLEKLLRDTDSVPRYREAAKLYAEVGNSSREDLCLSRLLVHLVSRVNKGSLSVREDDLILEEAETVVLRLLELAYSEYPEPTTRVAHLAQPAVALQLRSALRLHRLGMLPEARGRLVRVIALAEGHGLDEALRVAKTHLASLEGHGDSQGALACVHCGRTNDPTLVNREYQLQVRNRGRQYFFAQCGSCRDHFAKANTGYFALRTVVGGYPEGQLRRALAPGSDELWIA